MEPVTARLMCATAAFLVAAFFYFRFIVLDFKPGRFKQTPDKVCLNGLVLRVKCIDFVPIFLMFAPNTSRGCCAWAIFFILVWIIPYVLWLLLAALQTYGPAAEPTTTYPLTGALVTMTNFMATLMVGRFLFRFANRFFVLWPAMIVLATLGTAIAYLCSTGVTTTYLTPGSELEQPFSGLFWVACICFVMATILHHFMKAGVALLTLNTACTELGIDTTRWLEITRSMRSFIPKVAGMRGSKYMRFYAGTAWTGVFQRCILVLTIALRAIPGFGSLVERILSMIVFSITRRLRQSWARGLFHGRNADRVKVSTLFLRTFPHDSLLAQAYCDRPVSMEERIIRALLAGEHRVVALGKPGENMPPLGAERFYVADADWQRIISKWMTHAYSVVMIAGVSRATHWELEEILRLGINERVLILFPLEDWQLRTTGDGTQVFEDKVSERLNELGLEHIDRSSIPKGEVLIGAKLRTNSKLLLTAPDKYYKSIQEAIKYHLYSLPAKHHSADGLDSLTPAKSELDDSDFEGEFEPAFIGFLGRVFPAALDLIFLLTTLMFAGFAVPIIQQIHTANIFSCVYVCGALYTALSESIFGGTLATRMVGAAVTDHYGGKISFIRAVCRFLVLWGIPPLIFLLTDITSDAFLFLPEFADNLNFIWHLCPLIYVWLIIFFRSFDSFGRSIVDRWFDRIIMSKEWAGKLCVQDAGSRPASTLKYYILGLLCIAATIFSADIRVFTNDFAVAHSGVKTKQVAVAKRSISQSALIMEDDVELKRVAIRRLPEKTISKLPIGRKAATSIVRNYPILETDLLMQ